MDADQRDERLAQVADAFTAACRAGERPDAAAWAARHPELAPELAPVLLAVANLEGLRSTTRPTAPMPGCARRIGGFRLGRELGRGGMGVVHEAVQEGLDRPVAIKLLPQNLPGSALQRFQREARLAASLNHPNIVPIHDCGETGGQHYYAMARIDGSGLDRLIDALAAGLQATGLADGVRRLVAGERPTGPARTALPVAWHAEAAALIAQAADALAHAHEKGVLHRDIKPGNLLLDTGGRLWVADFGLAKALDDATSITASSGIAGTLRYLAPERFDDQQDARCDLYALGLVLWELLALAPAFPQASQSAVVKAILQEGVPRLPVPGADPALATILADATRRDPRWRIGSAATLAARLRAPARQDPTPRPIPKPEADGRRPSPWLIPILAAIVLGLWLLGRPAAETPSPAVKSAPATASALAPAVPQPDPAPHHSLPPAPVGPDPWWNALPEPRDRHPPPWRRPPPPDDRPPLPGDRPPGPPWQRQPPPQPGE